MTNLLQRGGFFLCETRASGLFQQDRVSETLSPLGRGRATLFYLKAVNRKAARDRSRTAFAELG